MNLYLYHKLRNTLQFARIEKSENLSVFITFLGEIERFILTERTDENVIKVAKKLLQANEENKHLLKEKGLLTQEKLKEIDYENSVYNLYIPVQRNAENIKALLIEIEQNNPEFEMKDYMKHFQTNYSGTYDGKILNQLVKEFLNR